MSKTVLFLANYFDVLSVSKHKSELHKLTGIRITDAKLKRHTWAGLTFSDEYLSLKLHSLFPERVPIKTFCKESGIIKPLDITKEIEL